VSASSNPFAEINPYAAPQVAESYQAPGLTQHAFAGLWRQGNLLVMHKAAAIPDVCWLSNQPSDRRLLRKLYWHHPAVYAIVLASPLIYIIVAVILQKRATIQLPLTEEWFSRRRTRMLIAWGLALFSIVVVGGGGIALADTLQDATPLVILAAFLLTIGALVYGLTACRLITPQRITDQYVWVKGVNPDYLNRLEPWVWKV
jgi:hypothetical protein